MAHGAVLSLLNEPDIRRYTAGGWWSSDTIYGAVREWAQRHPSRIAIREATRCVSYAELVAAADALAGRLAREDVRPGQRVAVWLPSRIETAVAVLACSRQGFVCAPSLHRDHTVGAVRELLERTSAAALITEPQYGADADRFSIVEAASSLESMKVVFELGPRSAEWEPAFADGLDAGTVIDLPIRTDPNSVVYLAFTSGSTGRPKGVMHSDNTLLAPVRALAADWDIDDSSVVYSLSPLSHNLGFGAMILALFRGAELVLHDLARGASLVERLRATGATFLFGVPTHAIDLLSDLKKNPGGLPLLRGFRISGASVPPVVAQQLLDHGITPQSGYGMTEAGSHHYTLPRDTPDVIVETSGRACAGYEVRIFSSENPDLEVPVGEVGQIGGRGASLMLGYFDDQRSTERSFNREGWFMTGDLGVLDESGCLRVTGRKKDLIIRGGHNIYPARIESLAVRHPLVDRAAAIPVPDERLGEKVCLVVAWKSDDRATAEMLLSHLDAAGLSRYDMPEYLLELESLPLLPSGKISKADLLDMVATGRVTPEPIRFSPTVGTSQGAPS